MSVDPAELSAVARHVAVLCARLIVDERPEDLAVQSKSTLTDAVTIMDKRSEELARQLLTEMRSDDGMLGEEGLDKAGTTGITWVVDPIDGTVNYLYGIPDFCVSVAAVEGNPRVPGQWRPVAGAVCSPLLDEIYVAHRGGGAWARVRDDARDLRFAPADNLATSLLATGFGYAEERRREQGAALARLIPHVRDIRRRGSAALDICHVASGELDAYYEKGVQAWDIAAAWIIAEEAGAVVTGLADDFPSPDLTIVGSAQTIEGLRSILRA